MSQTLSLAPARPAAAPTFGGLAAELTAALGVASRRLRQPISLVSFASISVIVLAVVILADSATTVWGMSSGISEEANPIAAWGMEVIGLAGYIGFAGVLAGVLALPLMIVPTSPITAAARVGATVVVGCKLWVVVSNFQILFAADWGVPYLAFPLFG